MQRPSHREPLCSPIHARTIIAALTIALALTIAIQPASAQTYNVIYNFIGPNDGATPYAGVTLDGAGNLYGTTSAAGHACNGTGGGTVFELARRRGVWLFTPLYYFSGNGSSGCAPTARVVFGPDSALYGTTSTGGPQGGGTVFKLLPPIHVCASPVCLWSQAVLYGFGNQYHDASDPSYGDLVFDHQGNIYGTTILGGGGLCNDETCGTVYKLTPAQGTWTESIICEFQNCGAGYWPYAGVVFDTAGNLYGTTAWGGGGIYELSPNGSGWNSTALYSFLGFSEGWPEGGVILDSAGNLYGTTAGGSGAAGSVFELTHGGATLTVLHSFGTFAGNTPPGPSASLVMDAAGNLYGTTYLVGAHGNGSVFKLSPSNGSWTFTTLHDFTGGVDGGQPWGQLTLDANGNLYGTTTVGGTHNVGVVFEITP